MVALKTINVTTSFKIPPTNLPYKSNIPNMSFTGRTASHGLCAFKYDRVLIMI